MSRFSAIFSTSLSFCAGRVEEKSRHCAFHKSVRVILLHFFENSQFLGFSAKIHCGSPFFFYFRVTVIWKHDSAENRRRYIFSHRSFFPICIKAFLICLIFRDVRRITEHRFVNIFFSIGLFLLSPCKWSWSWWRNIRKKSPFTPIHVISSLSFTLQRKCKLLSSLRIVAFPQTFRRIVDESDLRCSIKISYPTIICSLFPNTVTEN